MNKYIFLFCLLLYSRCACAQDSRFYIKGTVDSKYNGNLVTLFTITGNIIRSVDSTYVENGRFGFTGSEYLYEKSIISLGNYPDTVLSAELYLERGFIEVELKRYSVISSPLALKYQLFLDSCAVYQQQISAALKRKENVEELELKLCEYKYRFKKKYIRNGLGRELFLQEAQNIYDPYFDELYEMLPDRDKYRGDVKTEYENRKKRLNQQFLTGKQYMDFTLIDTLGNEKRISDYIGKHDFLFIDFWASWCGPCRAQEPHLVRLYREYKDKGFEILRVSLDVDRVKWLSMLKKTHRFWPELCVANGEDDKRIRKLYNIAGIPFGVIVDKAGKITAVVTVGWQHLEMFLKAYYKDDNGESTLSKESNE